MTSTSGADSELPQRTIPRGTYRVSDGTQVEFGEAMATWVPLAHVRLLEIAGTHDAVITHNELAARVQGLSGIRTRMRVDKWIGWLLDAVAKRAEQAGEPPLTALCVRQDGSIGPAYPKPPKPAAGGNADVEMYAAEHRLLCYQRYATDLPSGGGEPTLTAQVQARRTRKPPKREEPEPERCPVHFTTLPASGQCDYCDMA